MRLRRLLLMLLPFPALAQVGSLHGTLRDAETKQPLADVTVTATSPRLEVGQVTVTNAAGEYRIEQLPPGLYVLTFERPSFLRSIRNPVALRARREVRVDVALVSERAAAGFLRHAAPAPREQGCTGLVDDTCVPQLEVACTEPRDAAVRTFVPLAQLAPRSDVTVYAVSSPAQSVFIPAKKQVREP